MFSRVEVDLTFRVVGSHTQNASLSSAVSITVPAGANYIMMQSQTKGVRFTLDGTVPTATKGFALVPDDPPLIVGVVPGQVIKAIEVEASAKLDYQFGF